MQPAGRFLAGLYAERLHKHVAGSAVTQISVATVGAELPHVQVLAVNLKNGAKKALECRIILDRKRHKRCGVWSVKCVVWNVECGVIYAGRESGVFAKRSSWPDLGLGNSKGRTISG